MKNLNVKRISLLVLGIASVIGSIVFFRTSIANLFDSFAKAQWEFMQNSSDEIGIVCFVFLVLLVLVFIIYLVYCHDKKVEKKKIEIEKKEKEERDEVQREKNKQEISDLVQKIFADPKPKWEDILTLAERCDFETQRFTELKYIISKIDLVELFSICTLKQQIVWGRIDLRSALTLLEDLANDSYDDFYLRKLIEQLDRFINIVAPHKNFVGYEKMIIEISAHYSTVWGMLTLEQRMKARKAS